jgi:hypothetical protein
MGFFRTSMECSASALITGTFFIFPLGVAFWPDTSSLPEFTPLGGNGIPVATLAMLDLDDLVREDFESNTDGAENEAMEEIEADQSDEAEGTDAAEVAIESSNTEPSTQRGATKAQDAAERKTATRQSQSDVKRKRAEETALARAEKAGKGKGKGKDQCLAPDERITKLSKGSYTLESELVDQYTGSLNSAKSLVRGMGWSYDEDGDKDGFQLFGVRCGSPLHQAGLRSKDVIHSINGKQIRSEVQAIAAWKVLRNKKNVKVMYSRKGTTRTMKYRVS